ncbi:MAG: ATP-binding protein [Deltaproteobacteria bacterium]|nr:ATP-binding protein [Deltaproteobacteria bacterium]MBM4287937.1 ATP-binding protein [Deltaproteobacteria bacterium]
MEPWYKVALPRKELREGRSLDPSEFAVHLEQIVAGAAPEDYQDPAHFFNRTFFGQALMDYCRLVLRRLVGETQGTAPVLTLLTQFGGGKTHTLATLYHLTKNGPKAQEYEGVKDLLSQIGLKEVPRARAAVFVGNAWSAAPGRETPWQDMARQLAGDAGYRGLGDDSAQRAPSTPQLQRLFELAREPVLLLFDEVLNYIERYPEKAGQFYAFVQNLTGALTASARAVGMLSLPASTMVEMPPSMMEWQLRLAKLVGREGKPLIVTEGEEIAEIIKRRLFESNGRKSMQQAVARQYARWIFSRRDRLPPEFAQFPEEEIRKRFEACYPFHPSTLTVFQRKWQTLPTFQQTRGTLVMLGMWIAQAFRSGYQKAWREPLLTLGGAPLEDREFRSKILEQLNETRLYSAIKYDIAGENAHAPALDKESEKTVGKSRLHQRVATALFFESCGGMAPDKAATLPDLRFALGDPETETTVIDAAVYALHSRCHFLRQVGTAGWRFGYKQNLRRLHMERKAAINPEQVEKQIRAVVQQIFRNKAEINLSFFPQESTDIQDRPALNLVVLDPTQEGSDELLTKLTAWTQYSGQSHRQFPGGIFWLVPASVSRVQEAVKDWLVWDSIKKDIDKREGGEKVDLGDLEKEDEAMVPTELRKAQNMVEDQVWGLYTNLYLWNGKDEMLKPVELRHMDKSEARSITGAVMARLRHAGELNQEVGPTYVERNWPLALKETGAWPLASLLAAFFQGRTLEGAITDRPLTRLEKAEHSLKQMIVKAVRQGSFGLGIGKSEEKFDRVWFKEELDLVDVMFDHETFLLLPPRAEAEKAGGVLPDPTSPEPTTPVPPGTGPTPPVPPVEKQPVDIEWRGTMPKEKWNLFSHRVLARLSTAESLQIEVTVKAKVPDPTVKQQLNMALQDLDLEGEF